ncbi:hypothetical protein [Halalkalicoccus salilacus]|uniref:hypothetical protein n=1 Tax=Halalkalicoccus sp. GCM10025704 TaxID=3252662 RepID=UPI0036096D80
MSIPDTLAIDGGEPAVTIDEPEGWQRPVEAEKRAVLDLLEEGLSAALDAGSPSSSRNGFGSSPAPSTA